MSVIGEAALSILLERLFEKIANSDILKFVSEKQVVSETKKWENKLKLIRDVLDDAEEKQMTKPSVKEWLSDLQDLAYDVEDILDEYATKSRKQELKGKESEASTSWFRKFIPNPRAIMFNSKTDSNLKKITDRLQAITDKKNDLGLENIGGSYREEAPQQQRHRDTHLPDEFKVYGRDEDKRKILGLIVRNDAASENLGVLPIVGMAGIGKTTLARLVYNDESLEQHFPIKAWISVSDDFDTMRITKGILESITSKPCQFNELGNVQTELQKQLAGKKFLIVLDDVWTESYDDWIALRPLFIDGAVGSRIIVTTRSMIVAQNMRTIEHHTMARISDADCWMLFRSHAFESATDTIRNEDIICDKVKSRCAGLPLAARTLGGLLHSKRRDRWEAILDSHLWNDSDSILPALRLSYHHLPSHLKRCFSYCAIFPKDYEFTKMEVVLLWMAEGLISTGGNHTMEDVGRDYFDDLLSRSLFQESSSGKSNFIMHDLVNDLARSIAGETCFRLEDEELQFRRERARHSSYICGRCDGIKKFEPFQEMPRLRTFLPLSLSGNVYCSNHLTTDVVYNLLPKLTFLRVLSFKGYKISELPESIGDLKHLRYLDLSFTSLVSLPESIVSLCNLQTLNLRRCENLKQMPSRIEELINLRHLDIEGAGLEDGLPLGVKELESLRTLSEFSVGKISGAGLTSLHDLKFLRGKLHIVGLENVTNSLEGREANLIEKKDLQDLLLKWRKGDTSTGDERSERELLDVLQPDVKLERLDVRGYGGMDFPVWVGDPSFDNLVFLSLENCRKCKSIPRLGLLQSLRNLRIKGLSSVTSVGREFYGEGCSNPFTSLETLYFGSMEEWVDWDPCGFEFPCLHKLEIYECPKLLGKLPNDLSKVKKLWIYSCEKFIISLPNLPIVSELTIGKCKEVDFRNMVEFGSTNTTVELTDISEFRFERDGGLIMEQLMKAKELQVNGDLIFRSQAQLPNFMSSFCHAETLSVIASKSSQLCFFQQTVYKSSSIFASLRHLTVAYCPRLVFSKGFSFPLSLRSINMSYCHAVSFLPIAVGIEELKIHSCGSLISIERSQLSSTLKRLEITQCKNLKNLHLDEEQGSVINLELLKVQDCPVLVSLSSSRCLKMLPPSLQHLQIGFCSSLNSIAESFDATSSPSLESILIYRCDNLRYLPKGLNKLIRLHEILIIRCPSLLSFPEGGLPTTASLKIFQVFDCQKLKAVPDNIHSINSLHQLETDISNLMNCKSLFERGFHTFSSLTTLSVEGGNRGMLSFPFEDMMLPPSLIKLTIINFPKLEYLSTKGFQNLASLEYLWLENCPKLASFPKDGLPLSLLQLSIHKCHLLKQRCRKDRGQLWLMIAHIPCVEISDNCDIFIWDLLRRRAC